MSLVNEFKEFAIKGNVIDMAVGVVIGAGFGKIVSALVADIITPPLGLIVGGVDFSALNVVLKQGADAASTVTVNYGHFLQSIFDFTIMAAALFALIKAINTLKRAQLRAAQVTAEAIPTAEEKLLMEIRDILRAK